MARTEVEDRVAAMLIAFRILVALSRREVRQMPLLHEVHGILDRLEGPRHQDEG
ncbi:MAG: hypothetical protein KDD47_21785 [Acidobacteria bacterium]|nr:hypothetical protein [Acidobacteriota bacterium]